MMISTKHNDDTLDIDLGTNPVTDGTVYPSTVRPPPPPVTTTKDGDYICANPSCGVCGKQTYHYPAGVDSTPCRVCGSQAVPVA
jgi:hypothetical protein